MKKLLFSGLLLLILVGTIVSWEYARWYDGKLHIIICDVGQGDSVLIRTPERKVIMYDAGPGEAVLDCLSAHMPFWRRNIDLALLSHPHTDHYEGFFAVLDRYSMKSFATEELLNTEGGYQDLITKMGQYTIYPKYLYAGDTFSTSDNVKIKILGPDAQYLHETSPDGDIKESHEFASMITLVSYGSFTLLLTGDSQPSGIDRLKNVKDIQVLQVPHHGSRTGLDSNILDILRPKLATISVGKNKYGHPSKDILFMLKEKSIKILRTDEDGDIEIVSDGRKWWVR